MSSPNDPGYPGSGDAPNGSGPKPGGPRTTGSVPLSTSDSGDVPPWQRGNRGAAARRAAAEPPRSPADDERTTRFAASSAPAATPSSTPTPPPAPEPEPPARSEAYRSEIPDLARSEAYRSELPDLSSPTPRSAQRAQVAERPTNDGAVSPSVRSRVQVGRAHKGPVRASMQLRRIDPWSVLKVSLVLSVALFFVWMIAVAFLYLVLGGMGVWSKLNSNVGDLLTNTSDTELVSSSAIFGGAAMIGLVNIVLLTAMATVGAFIYNLTTDLVGGVEVTLADRD